MTKQEIALTREKPRWYKLNDDNSITPITTDWKANFVGWSQEMEKASKHILETFVTIDKVHETRVSTVFMGLDHNHFSEGDPIVFETMTFSDNPDVDEYCERYTTYMDAIEGHHRIVSYLENGIDIKPSRKSLKLNLTRCVDSSSETSTEKMDT